MTSKSLIAVMTCQRPEYIRRANAQRATWVPLVRRPGVLDVVFFSGASTAPQQDDEVRFDTADHYLGIPLKVKQICGWAVEHGYSNVMKCDDDVYIAPRRVPMPLWNYDYVGRFRSPYGKYPVWFASGFSYWLSHYAARLIAGEMWNYDWMDERFVATVLGHHGIWGHTDPKRWVVTGPHLKGKDVAAHPVLSQGAVFCEYNAPGLHDMHQWMRNADPQFSPAELEAVPRMMVTKAMLAAMPDDTVPERKLHLCKPLQ